MNASTLIRHELIGLTTKVSSSPNDAMCGLKGTVIDESKNMLTLSDGDRKIMIPKDAATFKFTLKDGTLVQVNGYRLLGRPETRLKSKVRRW
ncbi:MAG: ribonuclease P protein component 1 [Candidatus Bathyarchaeia archaeon]